MKEIVSTYRQKALRLTGLLVAMTMVGGMGYAQPSRTKNIIHKAGATEIFTNEYGHRIQKTSTQRSIIYAIPGGGERMLKLPPQGNNSNASPTANYARWYDYTTDGYPTGLVQSSNQMWSCGIVFFDNAALSVQQARISLASGETERVIACDVSGYKDYLNKDNNSTPFTEPTLSYRSIFEIKDAHIIADKLRNCTGNTYLEDKNVYMPCAPHLGLENPKVTLEYDDDNYFGYNNNTLVHTGNQTSSTNTTQGSWRTSGNTRTRTHTETTTYTGAFITTENIASKRSRFCFITPRAKGEKIEAKVLWNYGTQTVTRQRTETQTRRNSSSSWGNSSYGSWSTTNTQNNSTRTYNIARYNIEFVDQPAQYSMSESNERSIKYLDDNYVLLVSQDFDYNTDPATPANNCHTKSLDDCSYGFVYSQLYNQRWVSNYVAQWNEYGFYKTAQVSEISKNGEGLHYTWYNNGNPVRDRKYYDTDGTQAGYFMYIDASNMPGTVARLRFTTPLCAGTKLIVSAGICNLVSGSSTDGDVNFVFKGVTASGEEIELNRYTSGNIPKVLNNTAGSNGYGSANGKEWYQAFYSFTIASEIDYEYYLLQVENNASDTSGGDYAVDDIRVYRSKPGIEGVQIELPCAEDIPKVKVKVEFDKLIEGLPGGTTGEQILRYRFLDENLNILDYDYGNEGNYGEIKFSTTYTDHPTGEAPVAGRDVLAGRETSASGTRYLVFRTPNNATLMPRSWYHVAIANANGVFEEGICGLISLKFRIEPPSYITVDGMPDIDTSGLCFGRPMEIGAVLKDRITMQPITSGYRFDWYLGSDEAFTDVYEALLLYRMKKPSPAAGVTNLESVNYDDNYTQEMHLLLQKEIEAGRLYLNRDKLQLFIQKNDNIRAIVIDGTIPGGTQVCKDIIEFSTSEPGKTPLIVLGTQYGESVTSTVRMSLAQFNEMAGGKKLEIPIYDYMDSNGNKTKTLRPISGENNIVLTGTNDTYRTDLSVITGTLTSITQEGKSLVVSFAPAAGFIAKEGYYYRMLFYFEEQKVNGDEEICNGSVEFNIKIVPEHLTWTGEYNDNWNNDANWKRSTSDELYDTGYTNDSNSQGYVPLEFSKVTIANAGTAPWLYKINEAKGLLQDLTNTNNAASKATDDIASDMVAQVKNGSVYNCINFYGNTCEQVYFKPQAEMRNTYCLNYTKAWTDFELTSGRWYMLASPLQGTVAGDMYLPTNGGRQETKAFENITFATDKNNRFNPAVYQRSWDHANSTILKRDQSTEDAFVTANWSNVYNKVDEKYEAGKGFSIRPIYGTAGVDKVMFRLPKADNAYSYYTYSGEGTGTSGNNTVITRNNAGRLNDWSKTDGRITASLENTSDNSNYFLFGNPYMASLDMKKFFEQNSGFEKKFWIITENGQAAAVFNEDGTITTSDPAVADATIAPMQSFFVEKTQTRATQSGNVTFTPGMTVAKPANGTLLKAKTRAAEDEGTNRRLYISAEREGKRSNILIEQRYDATDDFDGREDAEALMDSNLGDSPILYSIAGNRAVSINVMAGMELIPLGIYSKSNEEVTLSITGTADFGSGLELYDALLNESRVIDGDNTTFSVPGNTHGRYFLAMTSQDRENESNITIYSPEKNKVIVAATDKLQRIRVYNMNGMLVKELNNLNSISEELSLPGGIYLIQVESLNASTTGKVNCRN